MNGFPSDSNCRLSLEAMVYCIIPLYHIVRISQFDPSFQEGESSPGEMKGGRKGSKGSKQQMQGSEVGKKEAVVRGW